MDGKLFLNDILEVLYLFSRRINLGSIEKDLFISENEIDLIESSTKGLNNEDLTLFWQITIKTIEDLKTVSNEQLALEMYLLQLIHVKSIEEFDKPESYSSQGTSDQIGKKKNIFLPGNNKDPSFKKYTDNSYCRIRHISSSSHHGETVVSATCA